MSLTAGVPQGAPDDGRGTWSPQGQALGEEEEGSLGPCVPRVPGGCDGTAAVPAGLCPPRVPGPGVDRTCEHMGRMAPMTGFLSAQRSPSWAGWNTENPRKGRALGDVRDARPAGQTLPVESTRQETAGGSEALPTGPRPTARQAMGPQSSKWDSANTWKDLEGGPKPRRRAAASWRWEPRLQMDIHTEIINLG